MTLRDHDHLNTLAFLAGLERDGTKALAAPVFPGWGSGSGGSSGGRDGWGSAIFGPHQPGSKFDYAAQAGDVRRNSAVASGLSWIGNNFAEPAPRVMRRNDDGQEEEVPDHPLTRLIRQPNPFQSWQTLLKPTMADYKAWGDGFWLISKGIAFRPEDPINLWWMPRDLVQPVWDFSKNEFISGWRYWAGGLWKNLDLDQVIHFQDGVDPANNRMGLSALQSTLREVCSDNEAATYTSSVLRNMGIASYMLSPSNPDQTIGTKEERDEIAASMKERTTGENRGNNLVNNLALKVDRLGMTPEEMTLDKIMKIPESRICAALGIPAMVLGLAVGAEQRTFSNYAEARKAAYEDCLCPMQREWAFVINRELLPLLGDPKRERFEFDNSAVIALNESQDAKFTRAGDAYQKNKLVTKNEGRSMLGLPPVHGGDVFADGASTEKPLVAPADPETPPTSTPADVQSAALNGAQIASMVDVVAQVVGGELPLESARAVLLASFPSLSTEEVDAILKPTVGFEAPEPEAKPVLTDSHQPSQSPNEPDPAQIEDDKAVKAMIGRLEQALDHLGVAS